MDDKYLPIWAKAKPILKTVKKKNLIIHSKNVAKAMAEIIDGEGGDSDILIPAAILHDVGWSKVSLELQLAEDKDKKHEALVQHIKYASPIIREILTKLGYKTERINRIVDIVVAHKFTDPTEKEKQMIVDADTLSDTYKDSFYSDTKSYNQTPRDTWEFRSKNTFYTETAKEIFERQLKERLREIESGEADTYL